jgi:2-alkenal reductase
MAGVCTRFVYSESVRPSNPAVLALAAAVVGGVVALLVGMAVGVVGSGDETTVFAPTVPLGSTVTPSAAPLRGTAFDPAAIYARRAGGVVTIYALSGSGSVSQGSGFLVDGTGTILTNAHVITNVAESSSVRGASSVYVEFRDGERLPGKILGWDLFNDLGVIKVDPSGHAIAPVPLGDSAAVTVGSPVAAIGSPFGNQSSLTVGVVSATGRSIASLTSGYQIADAIQTDTPINRGNSGGPLFDARGRVIGINAQIRTESGTAEGVGFAIPINTARRALAQIVATGKASYAYIGVKTEDVTPGIAKEYGLGAPRGALVVSVVPGSPAARAGLLGGTRSVSYVGRSLIVGGDLIVAIAGKPVASAEDVSRVVADNLRPGQKVAFTILRDGTNRKNIRVTLGTRPPASGP